MAQKGFDNEFFNEHTKSIEQTNYNFLEHLPIIVAFMFLGLLFYSIFIREREPLIVFYLVALLFALALDVFTRNIVKNHTNLALPTLYFISIALVICCITSELICSHSGNLVSVSAVVGVSAFVILDKVIRIRAFIVISEFLFILLKLFILKPEYIIGDIILGICVIALSIFINKKASELKLKLCHFTSQRNTDMLTGLPNRRKLDDIVSGFEGNNNLGIVMLDIDWFKKYNDMYGHVEGNICLKKIGLCFLEMNRKLSETAEVFRYGGEEFLVLSHQPEKILELANNLLTMVQGLRIPFEDSPFDKIVTVSIGVASSQVRNEEDFKKLVCLADAALYKSKNAGRNKVTEYMEKP